MRNRFLCLILGPTKTKFLPPALELYFAPGKILAMSLSFTPFIRNADLCVNLGLLLYPLSWIYLGKLKEKQGLKTWKMVEKPLFHEQPSLWLQLAVNHFFGREIPILWIFERLAQFSAGNLRAYQGLERNNFALLAHAIEQAKTVSEPLIPTIEVFTIQEVATKLKVKERTVKHHLHVAKDLRYRIVGKEIRITLKNLEEFLAKGQSQTIYDNPLLKQ